MSPAGATLNAIGPMTRYRDHEIPAGLHLFGVRFRPGRCPARPIPDAGLPLEDFWGARARRLLDRLAHTPAPHDRARIVESALPPDTPGPIERAIAHLERRAGQVRLDDLTRDAGLSPRHFRRLCLERTGYTPKLLARILRFRRAAARLAEGVPPAAVAIDCGYYDQPHLIHDCRAFAGRTPNAFSGSSSAPEFTRNGR
jgi:AraC-like DNA-binding protein